MKVEKVFEKYTHESIGLPLDEKQIETIHCELCDRVLSKMERYHDYYDGWKPLTSTWEQKEKEFSRTVISPEGRSSWILCKKCNDEYSDEVLNLFSRNAHILKSIEHAKLALKRDRLALTRAREKIDDDVKKITMMTEYHRSFVLSSNDPMKEPPEKHWKWDEIQVRDS